MTAIPVVAAPGGAAPPLGPVAAPPAIVPLTFFAWAAAGLAGFGVVLALGADDVVADPRGPGALAVVHLGVLAALSTAVFAADAPADAHSRVAKHPQFA